MPSTSRDDQDLLVESKDVCSSSGRCFEVCHTKPYFPHRYRLFVMVLSGLALHMSARANFNLALVAMVNTTQVQSQENGTQDRCPGIQPLNSSTEPETDGEFTWSGSQQSQLLSGFYYGYAVLQIPGGYITERWGSHRVVTFSMATAAAINLLTPLCARYSYAILLASRILLGLIMGPIFVGMISLWTKWAPRPELALLVGGSCAGITLGEIFSFSTAGVLCHSQLLGGWPSVFYVYGAAVVVWCIFWWIGVSDSPHIDTTISIEEKKYIEENTDKLDTKKYRNPPVLKMMTSPAIVCIWLIMATDGFGFYVIFNAGAIYMKQILGFDIQGDGTVVGLQYAGSLLASFIVCPLADVIIRRGCLSTKNVRRMSTAVGELGLALALLLIALVFECNAMAVVVILVAGQFIYSFIGAGFVVNALDVAPMYAGTVTGAGNTLTQIMGFITPQMVNLITGENPGRREWSLVFVITSGIQAFGLVVYWICVQGEELEWSRSDGRDREVLEEIDSDSDTHRTSCDTQSDTLHHAIN